MNKHGRMWPCFGAAWPNRLRTARTRTPSRRIYRMMRVTALRGLAVIDPRSARKVGTVSDVIVDPAAGKIASIDIEPSSGEGTARIPRDQIKRVGQHAVMLTGEPTPGPASPAGPDDTWLEIGVLVGLEVI